VRVSFSIATLLLAGLVAAASLAVPDDARAARFRIRSYTLGSATHTPRPDETLAAERLYTQGLDIRGYDLLGDHTGSLSAVVDTRYTTDFAIPDGRRNDSPYAHRWNNLALRLAYVEYAPGGAFEARVGRQWSRGTLGIRDFDGLRALVRPRLDTSTRGLVGAYAGREVTIADGYYATDEFDVQGLPAHNDDRVDDLEATSGWPWIAGGRIGLEWDDTGSFEFAYRRRWRTFSEPDLETRTGSERFGVAAAMSPHRRLTLSASTTYHTLLGAVDRAELDAAWSLPGPVDTVSAGLEHRHPWFDAASIFNLFGTRPHQGGYLTLQQGVDPLATELEVRGWGRIYRGDPAGVAYDGPPGSTATRLGTAVSHTTDLHPMNHPVDWSTRLSVESDVAGEESAHLLADTRLRSPFLFRDTYLWGRTLLLGVVGRDRRTESGRAATFVAGADIPVRQIGELSLIAEHTVGSFYRPTTDLYATLELEFWPE
jgi:hypothetical protein